MSEPLRASNRALMLLKQANEHWKEDPYAGFHLPQDYAGLTECLDAGWIAPSPHGLGKYQITKAGRLQLGYAGEEIDDEHD